MGYYIKDRNCKDCIRKAEECIEWKNDDNYTKYLNSMTEIGWDKNKLAETCFHYEESTLLKYMKRTGIIRR